MKRTILLIGIYLVALSVYASDTEAKLAPTPPMGWMSWNLLGVDVNESVLKEMADKMVKEGFLEAGYNYIYIDDGWQGGRDNRNNMIPDPKKFPSGIKALADYMHERGLKLGIYSDASQCTCAGFTASYGFEQQDAKRFAEWGIDYLKYDYCGAPDNEKVAAERYAAMADALRNSGRDIVFGACEWGQRNPWNWANKIGAQLWRVSYDVHDKWKGGPSVYDAGIIDIIDICENLSQYAHSGAWNDMDMLVVGLNGGGNSAIGLNSKGCSSVEYESQMSIWCMFSSPLAMTNDLRKLTAEDRRILLNKDIIAINQDALCIQASLKEKNDNYRVYLKPLSNDRYAIAILNTSEATQRIEVDFKALGLSGKYKYRDVWAEKSFASKINKWKGRLMSHQTKVLILSK